MIVNQIDVLCCQLMQGAIGDRVKSAQMLGEKGGGVAMKLDTSGFELSTMLRIMDCP